MENGLSRPSYAGAAFYLLLSFVQCQLCLLLLESCGGSTALSGAQNVELGTSSKLPDKPVHYAYKKISGSSSLLKRGEGPSSTLFRGRPLLMMFLSTWDLQSQAQADFLVGMANREPKSSRMQYACVFLQEEETREIIEQYIDLVRIPFLCGLGDADTLVGKSDFGRLALPTVILLDEKGRMAWKHVGLVKPAEIRAHMNALEHVTGQ